MKEKNYVEATYIESGTFQGGEEDTFLAGIERGEEVVVMKKSEFDRLTEIEAMYWGLCK